MNSKIKEALTFFQKGQLNQSKELCLEILKQLEKSGHKISLPITKKGNKMDFFEWSFNCLF